MHSKLHSNRQEQRRFRQTLTASAAAIGAAFLCAAPASAGGVATVDWLAERIKTVLEQLPLDSAECEIEAAVQRVLIEADVDGEIESRALAQVQADGVCDMEEECGIVFYDALTNVDLLQPDDVDGYAFDSDVVTSCEVTDPCTWAPDYVPEPEPDTESEPEPELETAPEPELTPVPAPDPEPQPVPAPEVVIIPEPTPESVPPPEPELVTELGDVLDALERDATQCEYEAALRTTLRTSGATASQERHALTIVQATAAPLVAIRNALTYVRIHQPRGDEGYSSETGLGDDEINLCRRWPDREGGGRRPRPPMPPSGGGNSDY